MALIEINNLNFAYDEERPTLKNISLSIEAGKYVALIGHNGSGKSTLAKIIAGLFKKVEGDIKIFDLPLQKENLVKIRSQLGIVFQNPDNQFVASSVKEDIAFGLENRAIPHDEMDPIINEVAEEVGMEKFLDAAPENLSGGQKQRVAIAGTLAMKPRLLLLDEATSMLDPRGKKEILNLIRKMRKDNPALTIVSITHDVEEAALADEVIVLNDGEIVLHGTPEEVFAHRDILAQVRLDAPFFDSLVVALKAEGVAVPDDIKDIKALEDYLCR